MRCLFQQKPGSRILPPSHGALVLTVPPALRSYPVWLAQQEGRTEGAPQGGPARPADRCRAPASPGLIQEKLVCSEIGLESSGAQ